MKKYPAAILLPILLFSIVVFSCSSNKAAEEEADLQEILDHEEYFEGNFTLSPNAAFFEESITGAILKVDMSGLIFMIETEYPEIIKEGGKPIFIQLKGHLATPANNDPNRERQLVITKILRTDSNKQVIEPIAGIFKGNEQSLTISPDHTFELHFRNGDIEKGAWKLASQNIMILSSEKSKTTMRINYHKKTLNSREDNPVIYMLTSSSH